MTAHERQEDIPEDQPANKSRPPDTPIMKAHITPLYETPQGVLVCGTGINRS